MNYRIYHLPWFAVNRAMSRLTGTFHGALFCIITQHWESYGLLLLFDELLYTILSVYDIFVLGIQSMFSVTYEAYSISIT